MNYIELREWFKELDALNDEVRKYISSRCTGKATNV